MDNDSVASFVDHDILDETDRREVEADEEAMKRTEELLRKVTSRQLWSESGVAIVPVHEAIGDGGSVGGIITGGANLDKLFEKIQLGDSEDEGRDGDDGTSTTCSMSEYSLNSASLTFIKAPKSPYAKRHVRAVTSIIDPDIHRKINARRGAWSGCFQDQDEVYEQSIEVVYVPIYTTNQNATKNTQLGKKRKTSRPNNNKKNNNKKNNQKDTPNKQPRPLQKSPLEKTTTHQNYSTATHSNPKPINNRQIRPHSKLDRDTTQVAHKSGLSLQFLRNRNPMGMVAKMAMQHSAPIASVLHKRMTAAMDDAVLTITVVKNCKVMVRR